MPRRRYGSRRRYSPQASYVWQPFTQSKELQVTGGVTEGTSYSGLLQEQIPGTGKSTSFERFNNDHTLQRIRGAMSHNALSAPAPTGKTTWFPFSVAAIKVPEGLTISADGLDLFDTEQANDFIYRMDAVCNAGTTSTVATPNWHEIDSKRKSSFKVGDALAWLWSFVSPFTISSTFQIDVALNSRLLWKLKI